MVQRRQRERSLFEILLVLSHFSAEVVFGRAIEPMV